MPTERLRACLDSHSVKYSNLIHSVAFTMQEVAALSHIPGGSVCKTVMLFADDRLVMAVVPASKQVSLADLKQLIPAATITLATETEFRAAFPDCEVGAMPPFGNLYGLAVYVDESLRGAEMIFNAGSHRELIRMTWSDYERLVRPVVAKFTLEIGKAAMQS